MYCLKSFILISISIILLTTFINASQSTLFYDDAEWSADGDCAQGSPGAWDFCGVNSDGHIVRSISEFNGTYSTRAYDFDSEYVGLYESIDLSNCNFILVDFYHVQDATETGDYLALKIYDSSWKEVHTFFDFWGKGDSTPSSEDYVRQQIYISSSDYTFNSSNRIGLGYSCTGSSDLIFIDDVSIYCFNDTNKSTTTRFASNTGSLHNDFANPSYAYANDNTYAQFDWYESQDYYNFSLGIPSGQTIDGIEILLEHDAGGDSSAEVSLTWDGGDSYTSNKTFSPTTIATNSRLGNRTDTWGHTWTGDELNDTNFKVIIAGTDSDDIYLYSIKATVFYHATTPVSDTCDCPDVNNNWNINMSDNCVISSDCNLGTGKLNFSGSGTFTINATINSTSFDIYIGQTVYVKKDGTLYVS